MQNIRSIRPDFYVDETKKYYSVRDSSQIHNYFSFEIISLICSKSEKQKKCLMLLSTTKHQN